MIKKTRDIEIDESDIFKNDLLGRQSEIENLTPIIINVSEPLVLALDSPWGAGKTTFVRLWQAHLNKENKQSIYFNAWETDYADDPLIVLVAELSQWVKEKGGDTSKSKTWLSKIKTVLPLIAKRTAIVAVKASTLGALDLGAEYERTAAEFTGNLTDDLIESFNKQSESIQEFKKIIGEALSFLPDEKDNLVIFIDELDRCRPTYAIELLERIKHLFNIERLVFVLSTDTTQLVHSICAVYGNNFDAKKYLQRFIDLDYELKNPERRKYIDSQFELFGTQASSLKNCLVLLAHRFDLKPRDINLLSMRMKLILNSMDERPPLYPYIELFVFLMILREQNKSLYNRYVIAQENVGEVIEFLCRSLSQSESDRDIGIINKIIASLLIEVTDNYNYEDIENIIDPMISSYRQIVNDYDHQKTAIIKIISQLTQFFINGELVKLVVEKIELLHRMKNNV